MNKLVITVQDGKATVGAYRDDKKLINIELGSVSPDFLADKIKELSEDRDLDVDVDFLPSSKEMEKYKTFKDLKFHRHPVNLQDSTAMTVLSDGTKCEVHCKRVDNTCEYHVWAVGRGSPEGPMTAYEVTNFMINLQRRNV